MNRIFTLGLFSVVVLFGASSFAAELIPSLEPVLQWCEPENPLC